MGIANGLIGSGLNFVSQMITNSQQKDMMREQMDFNHDESALQRQFAVQQWERENAYNTPSAQIERLKAAGINPALAYSQGSLQNTAASSPAMSEAQAGGLPNLRAPQVDPLTAAEIAKTNAETDNIRSQTRYQNYMNAIEDALSHIPIGSVTTIDDNGQESVQVEYGNARVIMTEREMRALGLRNEGLNMQLNDIYYNLAVLTGSDSFPLSSPGSQSASEQPNYSSASEALRGNLRIQVISKELADIGLQAARAEKAGREAYAKWLEKHKDDPIVKFALTLQGFFQTMGISLPKIGHSSSAYSYGDYATKSESWFFK